MGSASSWHSFCLISSLVSISFSQVCGILSHIGTALSQNGLLLLLHLLQFNGRQIAIRGLLSTLHQYRPVFGDWQLAVERRGLISGFHVDRDIQFAVSDPAVDSMGGRDVLVIAANGGANMAMMGYQVVGGIEADPSELGQKHVNPGMGCVGR